MATSDLIRSLRKALGYSQQQIADKVGVSRSAIFEWERGGYLPDSENFKKLASALKTSVSFLMEETSDSKRYVSILGDSEKDSGDAPLHDVFKAMQSSTPMPEARNDVTRQLATIHEELTNIQAAISILKSAVNKVEFLVNEIEDKSS